MWEQRNFFLCSRPYFIHHRKLLTMTFYSYPEIPATLKLIGMDPGTETFGLCLMTVAVGDLSIISINAQTLKLSKLSINRTAAIVHGIRLAKIMALQNALTMYFEAVMPDIIGTESPFINTKMPQAYGALVEVVTHMRMAVVNYDIRQTLHVASPSQVKNAVGAKGNAGKQDVLEAIKNLSELKDKYIKPFELLDEHSIDATAVAFYLLRGLRERELHTLPVL